MLAIYSLHFPEPIPPNIGITQPHTESQNMVELSSGFQDIEHQ